MSSVILNIGFNQIKMTSFQAITISFYLIFLASAGLAVCDDDQQEQTINRVYSDVDESSCVCGLSKEILNKLESIVKESQSTCSISGHSTSGSANSNWQPHDSRPSSSGSSSQGSSSENADTSTNGPTSANVNTGGHQDSQDPGKGQSQASKLEDEIQQLQNQIAQLMSGQNSGDPSKRPSSSSGSTQTERPTQGDNNQDPQDGYNFGRPAQGNNNNNYGFGSEGNNNQNGYNNNNQNSGERPNQNDNFFGQQSRPNSNYNQNSNGYNNNNNNNNQGYDNGGRPNANGGWSNTNNQQNSAYNNNNGYNNINNQGSSGNGNGNGANLVQDDPKSNEPINSGFLGGLPPPSSSSNENEALNKLNQSQKVDSSDMQSALELTIPNVVSNIFSNIQNLTIQTELGKPNGGGDSNQPQSLTSIDGSSVSVSGSSTEQITAKGELLFLQWIDHQLQSLHLTASMAAYIQKNALSLFRRIVKQYVERVEKMGGKVEDNVRRATQIALNNTQNLISFLLKNYLNFAGGIMKIIGEQVSRVGKQLDSTGETIATINLNPFDIVSNVIDSLPNPSRYSEYFRAFGKYLMGESKGDQQQQNNEPQTTTATNNADNSNNQQKHKGLFSKTMGALGKTLGSWMG